MKTPSYEWLDLSRNSEEMIRFCQCLNLNEPTKSEFKNLILKLIHLNKKSVALFNYLYFLATLNFKFH
jgi:hypothetical protein